MPVLTGAFSDPFFLHRFYSETRQEWVAAQELRIGECLRTRSGQVATLESMGLKAGEHRVYNLEVEQEHHYFVGEVGVLVHNGYGVAAQARELAEAQLANPGVPETTKAAVASYEGEVGQGVSANQFNDPYEMHPIIEQRVNEVEAMRAADPGSFEELDQEPGDCAEPRALSDLLWKIDPKGQLTTMPKGITMAVSDLEGNLQQPCPYCQTITAGVKIL